MTGLGKDLYNLNRNCMNDSSETFYAKILLFGEYSVIFNSMGLAVPYAHFKGKFRFMGHEQPAGHATAVESNLQLNLFAGYLRKIADEGMTTGVLDMGRLESDILQGLYFDSSIPQGYGAGSSGALCAALYHRYAFNALLPEQILPKENAIWLKNIFSGMESYFHGQSSGLDPLLCYMRQPLLIREDKQVEIVGFPTGQFEQGRAVFLLDTGTSGKTEPLVNLFREKTRSETYLRFVNGQLIPVTHACILSLLEERMPAFFGYLRQLSELQMTHFEEMIPPAFRNVWQTGLQTDDYYLKLCGSGGGGFLLGMTPDIKRAKNRLHTFGFPLKIMY